VYRLWGLSCSALNLDSRYSDVYNGGQVGYLMSFAGKKNVS